MKGKMRKATAVGFAVLLSLGVTALSSKDPAKAAQPSSRCETSPKLVGACFVVHGRLSFYNGNPSVRIWPVGTHRLLGVLDAAGTDAQSEDMTYLHLAPPIEYRLRADIWRTDVYGDFTVCPFSRERTGWMQFVCIAKAQHLAAVRE